MLSPESIQYFVYDNFFFNSLTFNTEKLNMPCYIGTTSPKMTVMTRSSFRCADLPGTKQKKFPQKYSPRTSLCGRALMLIACKNNIGIRMFIFHVFDRSSLVVKVFRLRSFCTLNTLKDHTFVVRTNAQKIMNKKQKYPFSVECIDIINTTSPLQQRSITHPYTINYCN